MMTDWNTIEEYMANRLPANERSRFEATLRTDTELAEAVAFYVSTRQTLRHDMLSQRRAELMARPRPTRPTNWPYAVAAAACLVLLLGIGWVLWSPQNTATELADAYIDKNLTQLSVTMGADTDTLQQSIDLINKGELQKADDLLTNLLQRQPANAEGLKRAGIVSLRRNQYDNAISRFGQLSRQTDLYANPGFLLESVARIKRNRPNDKDTAKFLLQRVIKQNLEGSNEAKELLDRLQ